MKLNIKIDNKNFGNKSVLNSIDINIDEFGIYGIYGKNGAGKTTFFNCILNLTYFDGSILVDETPLLTNNIGYIPTEPFIYEYLTVGEFMRFFSMKILDKNYNNSNLVFQLDENILIKNLSTGMKKKAYINAVLQSEFNRFQLRE